MLNRAGATQLVSDYQIQNTGIDSDDAEACVVEKTIDDTPFDEPLHRRPLTVPVRLHRREAKHST